MLLVTCYLTGCGYTLQTRADLPFDTIMVGRIDNKSLEPKLQDNFNRVLAETFAEYGFRVGRSRYVLEGEISGFELKPVAEQSLVAAQYEVVIKAGFRLIDKESNRSVPLIANSPFVTYFGSTGRLESVLAQKELSTISALKNLSQEVVRQITYNIARNFAYLSLSAADIKDAGSLALKLQEPKDPVSRYIREELSYDSRKLVDDYDRFEYPSDSLKNTLAGELNAVLQKPSFYNERRFAHIDLTDDTRQLIRQDPRGVERTRLNRLLLEEAYPDEIVTLASSHILFTIKDIKDPGSLALKLQEPKDSLSRYIREQLSPAAYRLVDKYNPSEKALEPLKNALIKELNTLLQGPSLFNEERFASVMLSENTRELIRQNPKGTDRVRLNRQLLEEAYPDELAKLHKKPASEPPVKK
ncbi:MAG: LPS assembly lipoprotein LptE [Nitrospirae bacterium]|nr:LPS assembly lipoprotein LptE [Nitrospirota bacterium]